VKKQKNDQKNTVYDVKRIIGMKYNNENVQRHINRVTYKVVDQ